MVPVIEILCLASSKNSPSSAFFIGENQCAVIKTFFPLLLHTLCFTQTALYENYQECMDLTN